MRKIVLSAVLISSTILPSTSLYADDISDMLSKIEQMQSTIKSLQSEVLKLKDKNKVIDVIKTEIADLSKTGDYIDNGQGGYRFTGDKTFAKDPTVKKFDTKKLASTISKSLLKPSAPETIKPYYMGNQDMTMQTGLTGYTGTDIQGSGGGSLLKGVFSDEEQQRIMTYYKNMNLIGSS